MRKKNVFSDWNLRLKAKILQFIFFKQNAFLTYLGGLSDVTH